MIEVEKFQSEDDADWLKQEHEKTKQHVMWLGCRELNCGIF